jgi:hypothetical protein
MPKFTLITNCADPSLSFTTDIPLGEPLVGAINLTEIVTGDMEGDLCVTFMLFDNGFETAQAPSSGDILFNGKPYYTITPPLTIHPPFFIVWNNERWEAWESFDPSTGTLSCPNWCCETGDVHSYHLADPENTGTVETDELTGKVWVFNTASEAGVCSNPLTFLTVTELCERPVVIDDFINCWQTSTITERAADLTGVEIVDVFPDCESCLYPDTALATNCETQAELQVQLPEDFFYADGAVVTFEGIEGCWTLTRAPYEESVEVVVDESFKNCEECLPPPPPEPVEPVCGPLELHVLKSCNGTHPDILVKEDMTEFEGQVVWSEYFNGCFIVGEKEESFDTDYQVSFTIDRLHGDCLECLSYFEVEPDFDVPCCDEDKVQEVMCDFADKVHREIIAKRYGINTQDRIEYLKSWIRFESMKQRLRCLPHPQLPDPPKIPRFDKCPKPDCSN